MTDRKSARTKRKIDYSKFENNGFLDDDDDDFSSATPPAMKKCKIPEKKTSKTKENKEKKNDRKSRIERRQKLDEQTFNKDLQTALQESRLENCELSNDDFCDDKFTSVKSAKLRTKQSASVGSPPSKTTSVPDASCEPPNTHLVCDNPQEPPTLEPPILELYSTSTACPPIDICPVLDMTKANDHPNLLDDRHVTSSDPTTGLAQGSKSSPGGAPDATLDVESHPVEASTRTRNRNSTNAVQSKHSKYVEDLDSGSEFSEQSSIESDEESDFELPKEKRKITPKKKCPQKKTTKKAIESIVQKAASTKSPTNIPVIVQRTNSSFSSPKQSLIANDKTTDKIGDTTWTPRSTNLTPKATPRRTKWTPPGCAGESQSPDSSSLHMTSGLRLGLSKRAKLKPLHPTVEMS